MFSQWFVECADTCSEFCRTNKIHNQAEMAECCFTSTETVGLLGTGAQDDHVRLSHSS